MNSIKDATTNRNITTKVITLITIKATLAVIPVEMTIMTHKVTTSSKAPRTEPETETITATATAQMTNRVNTVSMDKTTITMVNHNTIPIFKNITNQTTKVIRSMMS